MLLEQVVNAYIYEPLSSHSNVERADTGQQMITHFQDLDPGYSSAVVSNKDKTYNTLEADDSTLSNFLSRPVRIFADRWTTASPAAINQTFNPWKLFIENPAVFEKVKYYNNLSGILHVKFLINGNSFLFGRVMVTYQPVQDFSELTVGNAFEDDYVLLSQRPKIFLNPTTNEGGQMSLPFFFYKNYMSVPKADWDKMGEITLSSLNPLLHATGENASVSINAYAYMTDVVLATPTALQSESILESHANVVKRDEYGTGIVSRPASAVATMAGWLTNIPPIAPYARATEMVATSVGNLARLFGFSRPAEIRPTTLVKPVASSPFATTDQVDSVMKLTLDTKCETTIDPRTVGLDSTDQMGIYDIAQRESFLTTYTWGTQDQGFLTGDVLFSANVLPSICTTSNLGNTLNMPPMAYMSQMFQYWHGSIVYRFQIVASQFHKGRLRVQYDPNQATSTDENKVYTEIIDIAETRDFEITVGWGSPMPFLEVAKAGRPLTTGYEEFSTTGDVGYQDEFANGQIRVTVLNELVVPGDPSTVSTSPPVSINVFVKAHSDMKFAVPRANWIQDLSVTPLLTSQSNIEVLESHSAVTTDATTNHDQMENRPEETMQLSLNAEEASTDPLMSVFYGEHITSLRQLFKRYCLHTSWTLPTASAGIARTTKVRQKALPFLRASFSVPGTGVYDYTRSSVPYSVNPAVTIPLTYCMPCFAGYRGAMRRRFLNITESGGNTRSIFTKRAPYAQQLPGISTKTYLTPVDITDSGEPFATSANGMEMQLLRNNCCAEVESPFYQRIRFLSPRIVDPSETPGEIIETTTWANPAAGENSKPFQLDFVSTGEDFTLFFFVNTPRTYRWDIPVPL